MAVLHTQDFFLKNTQPKGTKMPIAHFHDQHELYFLESGRTTYFIGSEIYSLVPGDFVFVPRGVFHLTDNKSDEAVTRVLFSFDVDFVGEPFQQYISEMQKNLHGRLQPEHLPAFHSLFKRVEQECKSNEADTIEMQRLYLCQLLIMLSRYRQSTVPTETNEMVQLVQDATRYIGSNYNQSIHLSDLAHRYSVSPWYFCKIFKQVTGTVLSEYINITRISAAQRMLEDGTTQVTHVALAVGFSDSNYFVRTFRKLIGITPKQYSLQYRRENQK